MWREVSASLAMVEHGAEHIYYSRDSGHIPMAREINRVINLEPSIGEAKRGKTGACDGQLASKAIKDSCPIPSVRSSVWRRRGRVFALV
jgi:hypothetical protein